MTSAAKQSAGPAATPRAVASGLLWGRVDCYVLSDGRRLISQRGELRALRGTESHGPEKGDLGRYLARLPSRYEHLTTDPSVDFTLPQGGATALGRTPDHFVSVLRAYVESYKEEELHARQVPMAKRAMDLLCLLAGKAINDMIDEACGLVRVASSTETEARLDRLEMEGERLAKENVLLRSKLDLLDPMGPGVIGAPRARAYILGPLRASARKLCAVANDFTESRFLREFRALEEHLREGLRYPAVTGGGKWENLPIPDFGDAMNRVASITERANRQADREIRALEARKAQLTLDVH